MVTLTMVFAPIWIVSYICFYIYIDKQLIHTSYNKNKFTHKYRYKTKAFITKDEQQNKRKHFAIIVGASIVTLIFFLLLTFAIFSWYQEVTPTFIFTLILAIILYIILKKFIKALAFQIFEKHKQI